MRRERLTFANVVAVLALVIALAGTGGVAYAHGMIGSADIRNGAVKTQHLAKGAVTTGKVKKGAIKTGKIAPRAVKTGKIAPGAVTRGKIAPDAVTGAKVKDGSLGAKDLNATTQSGLNIAAAQVESNGDLRSWFNRQGGAPTVTRVSAGWYDVVFPGTNPTQDSIVVVSPVTSNRTCRAGKGAGPGFFVQCYTAGTTTLADSQFNLVYVN